MESALRMVLHCALVLAVAGGAARAETPSPQALAEAQAHFKEGTARYNAKELPAAISEFEAAYRAAPVPGFLFNLGQAWRLLGDKRKAVDCYRRYLDAEPEGRVSGEAKSQIVSLTRAIESEPPQVVPPPNKATAAPAPDTAVTPVSLPDETQVERPPPSPLVAPPPDPPAASRPVRPLWRRWWLWTSVAAVVAAGAGVGLAVGLTRAPTADTTDGTYHPF